MGVVKKEAKIKIVKLMLQDIPTEEIAKLTNYGVGTIRKVFDELREEYNVKSKTGLAAAYLRAELKKLKKQIDNILDV